MGFEVNARTNANGSRFSVFARENVSTSGLGNLIKCAEKINVKDIELETTTLNKLLNSNKYSMIALRVHNDFKVDLNEEVEFGSLRGFKVVQTKDGFGYKSKGSRLFKI